MSEKEYKESPPTERARTVLLGLIGDSDGAGNGGGFDPWPLAAFNIKPSAETLEEWKRLRAELCREEARHEKLKRPLMRRPEWQVLAAQRCLGMRSEIEAGVGGAVLDAIAQCASHGLVMPAWLASAFVARHQRVVTGECRDWNSAEAFGSALRKGESVAGLRARRHDAPWAYEVATKFLIDDPKRALDRGFYEAVGEIISKGHARVHELISEYLAESDGIFPPLAFVREGLQAGHDIYVVRFVWSVLQEDKLLRASGLAEADFPPTSSLGSEFRKRLKEGRSVWADSVPPTKL